MHHRAATAERVVASSDRAMRPIAGRLPEHGAGSATMSDHHSSCRSSSRWRRRGERLPKLRPGIAAHARTKQAQRTATTRAAHDVDVAPGENLAACATAALIRETVPALSGIESAQDAKVLLGRQV